MPLGRRSKLEVALHDWGGTRAVYAKVPDFPEMLVWERRLRRGDLFLDIGANVGVYSVFAADLGVRVIAVEPGSIDRLERNVALNGLPVEIVQVAVTDHEGTVRFDPSRDTVAHIGSGPINVPATTLDALLGDRTAAGVKVDVEGAERLVIEGARRALGERRIACLQLEWNTASEVNYREPRSLAAGLLERYGYGLYRPNAAGELMPLREAAPGADVFALPEHP